MRVVKPWQGAGRCSAVVVAQNPEQPWQGAGRCSAVVVAQNPEQPWQGAGRCSAVASDSKMGQGSTTDCEEAT
ncbi:hypothetical protein OIU79_004177 [Salix purpurea]|uniref:Uncharacterized protein n=1 Tax=Salix purpurea TaxID=77065 RepID=A0A9Q0U9J1_SALPP|nr:hypothetical protein OIU79_004177 [Salix purpurea]